MALHLSDSGTHFVDGYNQPFLWLADTAWNAPLRGSMDDWKLYLSTRKKQGFTVIQFVTMPWHGCTKPVGGPGYTIESGMVVFHEAAWEYLDAWIHEVRQAGLIPAPVMLWSLLPHSPGRELAMEHAIEICHKQIERWGTEDIFWLLTGDAEFRSPDLVDRWKILGRAVFKDYPEALVTMHTCGATWPVDLFADEPWYTFGTIQSGHGASAVDMNFLLHGPFSYRWQSRKIPFINLEPCYEFAKPFNTNRTFTREDIRRTLMWSLLSTPTAGVTYGNNSIWVFPQSDLEEAEGHGPHWMATHWKNGLETECIEDLMRFKDRLTDLPWHEFSPINEWLFNQPGYEDYNRTIRLSATPSRDHLIAYLGSGGRLTLAGIRLDKDYTMTWWSPRSGREVPATASIESFGAIKEECYTTLAPDERDWVFIARPAG